MSSDPPPPDNPPTSAVDPSGPPQAVDASPNSQTSVGSAPSEPAKEVVLQQAFDLARQILLLGPARGDIFRGPEWFTFATSFANAIGEGYASLSNFPDIRAQLTQLPLFSDINASFCSSIMSAAARLHANEGDFQRDLENWRRHETQTLQHRLKPVIEAEVEKWRENRYNELLAKAAQEAESLASIHAAQSRSRAKTRGGPPQSPTPRRDNSTLGKRNLTEASDDDSEMDTTDGSSTSLRDFTDVTRTPRAKRSAHKRPIAEPNPPPPPTPSDPLLANIASIFDQRLAPIIQRISMLENKSSHEFSFRPPALPPKGPPIPPAPQTNLSNNLPPNLPPPSAPQTPFIPVSRSKKKGKNSSYATAAATPPPQPNPNPNPKPPATNPKPRSPKSTEITVQRPSLPAEPKASRRSADGIVASVQLTLREAKSDIPLLFGRWAAHTNNFVYVFSGDIPYSRIQQIGKYLLGPFPGGTLAPVGGWSRILLTGIPTSDDAGKIHSEADLETALRLNPILERIQFVMPPRWLLRPDDISKKYAALTFSVHDPDGSLTKEILQSPIGAFGARALPRRFESRPPLRQCARCHRLGHTASDPGCQLKRDAVRCYLCAGTHTADDHPTNCRRASQHEEHGICNCPVKCINCRKAGHHALDLTCPDRARFRIPGRNTADPNPPAPHV